MGQNTPKLKKISMSTPFFMPKKSDSCIAFYLENKEELYRALFNICVQHRISVGRWDSYYESDRNDFDKFKKEIRWNSGFIKGLNTNFLFSEDTELPDGSDWYIFQHYRDKDIHWSENREQEEELIKDCMSISRLSVIKENVESFFAIFEEK